MKLKQWGLIGLLGIGLVGLGVSYGHLTNRTPSQGMMGGQMMGNMGSTATTATTAKTAAHQLALPPLLKPTSASKTKVAYTLTAQTGALALKKGAKTATLGYNGNYLGPVLRVKRGQILQVTTKNKLKQATSFHWHGAILPGNVDGGPGQSVAAGQQKTIAFKVSQSAATLWYHPHAMGSTAKQVYQGLAGLIYVQDAVSQKLNLPDKYGVDDFPVVIQDRNFTANNQFDYAADHQNDGTTGKTLLINGTLNPYIKVTTKLVRLRFVNGSNARNYRLTLSNGQAMHQIATDGGLLAKPVAVKTLKLAPGERAEVVIDTSKLTSQVTVKNGQQRVLALRLASNRRQQGTLPNELTTLPTVDTTNAQHQTLSFSGMGSMVSINHQQYDPSRVNLTAKQGQNQVWTLKNTGTMMGNEIHPFHLHGVQFRILSINGQTPPANLRGYKDTVALTPGSTVKIAFKFQDRGTYVYHCHNLEHEENGMMGQIKVS
ncbi:multicopper oxidase family protein [Lactiplantibacillus fabifermentans]|uniref:Multicopper oxidase mco domain protein n=2 Tax=Lactiplantibacillus fabifermentans TaxID=483011 RepID=A0A0R2N9K9_9LACO|nr:multicopper oxidase domain-containing protein [Lactiplantibacillus fabifermentans]ETY75203.1 multicopper oxidase [Lactiplantibacillus fabifermentans T30PCM01]KRO22517.1 multicopper oxidase mco domain protein [Lactiplantibacillus fabifermentans DSM 21115]